MHKRNVNGQGSFSYDFRPPSFLIASDTLEWHAVDVQGWHPAARGYHTMATEGSQVYVFGGKTDPGGTDKSKSIRCVYLVFMRSPH